MFAEQGAREYLAEVRKRGCTSVYERQKNRYIDEFLRFCEKTSKTTNPKRITASDLTGYGKHLEKQKQNYTTARTKMLIAIQWCRWLAATKKIAGDPSEGMNASAMVSGLRKDGKEKG
ncbi:MAG: hypothetical protein ABSH32_03275 [Bryobacteraceae bacterium]